jgi:hypothetical protein
MLELSSWVSVVGQFQELVEFNIVSEERSGETQFLASNDNDFLSSQERMSDL